MTLEQAQNNLSRLMPKYTIIGIKEDGMRGRPAGYQIDVNVSPEENVFDMLKGYQEVRVFEMVEVGDSHDWLKKRNDFVAARTVKEEKELLRILKERYEND